MSIQYQQRSEQPALWHALERTEVEQRLQASEHGLAALEVEPRLARYGRNELEAARPPSAVSVFLRQFRSPLIYILLLAAGITLILGDPIDAAVITAVLVLNAVIGFTQEWKAEAEARTLMQLVAPHARVIREGSEQVVESAELVPGDLVLLESGARIPADLRLVATTALVVNESLLTGESLPVAKVSRPVEEATPMADRKCMAYAGSVVTSGRGHGYVVATGAGTELGRIAQHVQEEEQPETPLQRRVNQFGRVVSLVVLVTAALAFGVGVAIGEPPVEMFMVAVSLAVAAVPEGLPAVFTIALAVGVRRMARRHAIVRRLPAVETLGSTTVIGSDKTGTLTENRMTVQEVWTAGRILPVPQDGSGESARYLERNEAAPVEDPLFLTLLTGVLSNEAHLQQEGEECHVQGDPTETALLVAATRLGVPVQEARGAYSLVAEVPFEPERQYSASFRERGGEYFVFVKGAPERLLVMCTHMITESGLVPLDPERIRQAAQELASRGLRVLGMAYRTLPHVVTSPEDVLEPEALTFLGLQGMLDPPRTGVREAIAGCQRAGIRVVMITGDHAITARTIGRQLGIGGEDPVVRTGSELDQMDEETLRREVETVSIYSRVRPEQKLRIVRALQSRGEVVAVTGDGVNDAPALKASDIGIAMGRSGTDVAREASDILLADDNFVSIYSAVEEGRITFDNLRKATFFLISSGVAALLTILIAQSLGWRLPLLPAQLLWLNLVTNGLQGVALAFELGEPGVRERPPRSPREGILSALLWERTVLTGLVMAVGTLFLFRWELDQTGSLLKAQTMALTAMVLFQNFHAGNARSEYESGFHISLVSNRFLFLAVGAALGLHALSLYLPVMQFVLRVEPIELEAWGRIVLTALSVVVVVELHKWIRRRHPLRPRFATVQARGTEAPRTIGRNAVR